MTHIDTLIADLVLSLIKVSGSIRPVHGDFEKSHKIYQDLILSNPKDTTVIDSYGMSLLMSNKITDSVELLKTAVKNRNFTNITLYNLGCANQALGHFSTSNLYFKCSYKLSKRWKTLFHVARNHFLVGDFKAAFLTQLLCNIKGGVISKGSISRAFSYMFFSIMFGFAVILSFTLGKMPIIGAFYYKKTRPALWFEDVLKLQLEGFPDAFSESIKFLQKLILIDPHNELLLYNLGVIYAKLGNKPMMLVHFNKIPQESNLQDFIKEISKLSQDELKEIKIDGRQES